MDKPTTQTLEVIKAMLRPQDRHRLRPDGLLEPLMPPLHFCGGLEAPYLVGRISPDSTRSAAPEARVGSLKVAEAEIQIRQPIVR